MFTGIIESLGTVESVQNVGGDVRLRIALMVAMCGCALVRILICQMYIWVTRLPPMAFASR